MSLLEIMVVVSMLAVIGVKLATIVQVSGKVVSDDTQAMAVEDQARVVIDRICDSLKSSDRLSLAPVLTPQGSSRIDFRYSLGWEDGATVWSPDHRIELDPNSPADLYWRRDPESNEELSVVWSRTVQDLLEGEEDNGVDDNGNGLVDESGLSIVVTGNLLTIRLSLGTVVSGGEEIESTIERTLTVRNRPVIE
ncbi:MAG: hypothetical protein AAFZ65_02120 [Planctomycetota bacterium]